MKNTKDCWDDGKGHYTAMNCIDISTVKKAKLKKMVDTIRDKHTEEKIVKCLSEIVCDRQVLEFYAPNNDHFEIEAMIVAQYLLNSDLVN